MTSRSTILEDGTIISGKGDVDCIIFLGLRVWGCYLGVEFPGTPNVVVDVFFGTNRRQGQGSTVTYGPDPGALSLGKLSVSLPRDRRIGSLPRPRFYNGPEDITKHVVLIRDSIELMDTASFVAALRSRFIKTEEAGGSKEALIFIHGFSTTFEEAAWRTAQIVYDLEFHDRGIPILYSWPSRGVTTPAAYRSDQKNVAETVPHLRTFIDTVTRESGADRIYLLAHSMGNLYLTETLKSIVDSTTTGSGPKFSEIILTAPDIDAHTFMKEIAPKLPTFASRTTLYASSQDKALSFSKTLNAKVRAGDTSHGILISPGFDSIDASAVNTDFIGHSYYGENRSVLSDIHYLIDSPKPASARFGLYIKRDPRGVYWEFRP